MSISTYLRVSRVNHIKKSLNKKTKQKKNRFEIDKELTALSELRSRLVYISLQPGLHIRLMCLCPGHMTLDQLKGLLQRSRS